MDTKTNAKIIISAVVGIILGAGGVMAFSQKSETATLMGSNTTATSRTMQKTTMMSALEGKMGEEFDREFIVQMTIHHEGAIQMAELALKNAERPEIKQLSEEIIRAQNTEISQMQQWDLEWFGSPVPVTSGDDIQPGSAVHEAQ